MNSPVLILASSRKYGGVCLAGKTLDTGLARWVRPVSRAAGQAWPQARLCRVAGSVPQAGDLIELPLGVACPEGHQQENRHVGPGRWRYCGSLEVGQVRPFEDLPEALWPAGFSSVHGLNDRVPAHLAHLGCNSSLALVRPQQLQFQLGMHDTRAVLRAGFHYRGTDYLLRVTDEAASARWTARLLEGHDGHAEALLCLSLGLPFHDYCYKLVAGIIEAGAQGRA